MGVAARRQQALPEGPAEADELWDWPASPGVNLTPLALISAARVARGGIHMHMDGGAGGWREVVALGIEGVSMAANPRSRVPSCSFSYGDVGKRQLDVLVKVLTITPTTNATILNTCKHKHRCTHK